MLLVTTYLAGPISKFVIKGYLSLGILLSFEVKTENSKRGVI